MNFARPMAAVWIAIGVQVINKPIEKYGMRLA
jgi:hypothetical protein